MGARRDLLLVGAAAVVLLMVALADTYVVPGSPAAWLYALPILVAAFWLPPKPLGIVGMLAILAQLASDMLQSTPVRLSTFYGVGLALLAIMAMLLARHREALRHSEVRYRELFDDANDIVYSHNLAGHFTAVNRAGERLTGYRRDEVLDMTIADVLAPEYRDLAASMVARRLAGDAPATYEVEIVAKDGRRVPLEISARLIYEGERPVGVQGIARNLTERRRAEVARAQLADEQATLQTVAERSARLRALHDAALTLAAPQTPNQQAVAALLARIVAGAAATLGAVDGSLVLAEDPAWAGLLPGDDAHEGAIWLDRDGRLGRRRLRPGGATARVLGSGESVSVPDTAKESAFGMYQALAEGGVRSFALAPLRAGEQVLGALSLNFSHPGALAAEDQEVFELFAAHAAAALDRVRLVAAERQMALQASQLIRHAADAAALRELDRLKDELLSTVSHELRTPLTVVHGYARMLQTRATTLDPAALIRIASRIATASTQLTRLVEDILDFGRLQRGEVQMLADEFDLVPLLEEVVEEWRGREGAERVATEWPTGLPVRGDRDRVAQAVANLLENALRYAPEAPITVRARLFGPGGRAVRVEVEDQGPGISLADQPRVWEKFFRGAGVAELNVARGSGIGLAVVKALVEAHGGHVGLESTPGLGARFWFELPAAGMAAAA